MADKTVVVHKINGLVDLVCIVGAIALMAMDKEGWGWLIFAACII